LANIDIKSVEDLIRLSPYLGLDLVSLSDIREKQEVELVESIIQQSLRELRDKKLNSIQEPYFFIGSVDFMVNQKDNGEIKFSIVEANGGNSRGISAIQKGGWEAMYNGFLETLRFSEEDPLILIGHPEEDILLYEKIFLAENFRRKFDLSLEREDNTDDSGIILEPYKKIIPKLRLKDGNPRYEGKKVDILIGDGIVRRKRNFEEKGKKGQLNAIVTNQIFPETDDKSLTYHAVQLSEEKLSNFRVYPLNYWRAWNKDQLISICEKVLDQEGEIVIKPYGGSGGRGIDIISKKEDIENKVGGSVEDFGERFGPERNPFPYTICEKVNFRPINWKGTKRNFDIRIYVARKGDELVPAGGLARVALEPFDEKRRKEGFVVNLSGYDGLDIDRGLALNKSNFNILNLDKKDFKDMFSASVTLFHNMVKYHDKIIKEWKY